MSAASWNPAAVRAAQGLVLTTPQRAAIRANMPVAPDGRIYADAVFEGGGMRGIAFLGAMRCLSDAGVTVRKAAGTSAGALTAAAVASRMPIAELEAAIGGMDFKEILAKKARLVWNGRPDDDLDNMGLLLTNLMVARATGQYGTGPLLDFSTALLRKRLSMFGDLDVRPGAPWYAQRELKIVASDITRGQMVVLPDDLPAYGRAAETFPVGEAVRLSMSIPLFFEPGALGDSVIVDGGILSSFPLWLFDVPVGVKPCCPTFGFQVSAAKQAPRTVRGPLDVVTAIMQTMNVARDRHYARQHDFNRVISIDASDVSVTDFFMGGATKDSLYARGYRATKDFLLRTWDWESYVEQRARKKSRKL